MSQPNVTYVDNQHSFNKRLYYDGICYGYTKDAFSWMIALIATATALLVTVFWVWHTTAPQKLVTIHVVLCILGSLREVTFAILHIAESATTNTTTNKGESAYDCTTALCSKGTRVIRRTAISALAVIGIIRLNKKRVACEKGETSNSQCDERVFGHYRRSNMKKSGICR